MKQLLVLQKITHSLLIYQIMSTMKRLLSKKLPRKFSNVWSKKHQLNRLLRKYSQLFLQKKLMMQSQTLINMLLITYHGSNSHKLRHCKYSLQANLFCNTILTFYKILYILQKKFKYWFSHNIPQQKIQLLYFYYNLRKDAHLKQSRI